MITMRRCWLRILILAATIVVILVPTIAWAQEQPPLTPEQAREAAQERMQIQIDGGMAPSWADAILDDPITLYDLSSATSGYLFPVIRSGVPAGYLTVAAFDVPNPVLEFSTGAEPPVWAHRSAAEAAARAQGMELCADRPLYLGPLSYGYELALSGRCADARRGSIHRVIDLFGESVLMVSDDQAQVPLEEWMGEFAPMEARGSVTPLAYKLIGDVPDYCQFGTGGCWSGCAPTAAANVLGYWDARGYPNLQSGGDWQQLVLDLGSYMATDCGSTSISNISPGLVDYAQAKGYYFESELEWTDTSYGLFRDEIDANRPLVLDLINAVEYWGANHSVTGVGYQTDGRYMIVHDALACGSNQGNHYIHYGSGWYSGIGMHPIGPDSTPPTQASNVRPKGWTGPYTSDATPSFRWRWASDSGSGIAGYYVAVDDWTPEGGHGRDWWVGNVTSFTVPDPLPDGEHIFAVTSKDAAGNVNPTNTNQKGDAPYYTFYVDTTAPTNPTEVSSGCEAENGIWQRDCVDPAFTWSGASDRGGSGIDDYHIYWGTDPTGVPHSWRSTASFDPGALDTSGGVATYYLRISTRDELGHESEPETVFVLRYDRTAPTANPLIAAGAETVYSLEIAIEPRGEDTGSGVSITRLSTDGFTWHSEPYAARTTWTLEPLNRRLQPVVLEVEDGAGNRSSRYQRWVCLDLYPPHPSSKSYRLWSAGPTVAGGRSSSSHYRLTDTVGQAAMGRVLRSPHYRLHSGFQALWPADPGSEAFTPFSCHGPIYLPLVVCGE